MFHFNKDYFKLMIKPPFHSKKNTECPNPYLEKILKFTSLNDQNTLPHPQPLLCAWTVKNLDKLISDRLKYRPTFKAIWKENFR